MDCLPIIVKIANDESIAKIFTHLQGKNSHWVVRQPLHSLKNTWAIGKFILSESVKYILTWLPRTLQM